MGRWASPHPRSLSPAVASAGAAPPPPRSVMAGGGGGVRPPPAARRAEGIPCRVYEAPRETRPLGVGITLLPPAVGVLSARGVAARRAPHAVVPGELAYYNRHGQLI